MRTTVFALVAASALCGSALPAAAQNATKIGLIDCAVSGGVGFLVTSSRALDCTFTNGDGTVDKYVGTIRRYGVDIGYTAAGRLGWAVFTPATGIPRGALAGTYVGGTAAATAIVGLGANALVGGSNRAFSLQPLSMEGQTGVAVAAGVGQLDLEAVAPAPLAPIKKRRRARRHR